ncbi:transketolase family protein [Lysinibacillus sp. OTC-L20]|uniref:transketolase family protein n=1 Tax=Lysinibacillus sp. OTC-L20 TaxID=3342791 RepID=UPI0035B873E5
MNYKPSMIRMWAKLGTRGTMGLALLELANQEDLIVLSADLVKTTGLERFQKKFPQKIYNMGIAEQNMIGVAAGLANEGFVPFVTTFANFATMRSYEQVRLHLGYMKLNVKILGIGSGLSMGMFGNTHYGIEDIALMRALPNMTIISPADGLETMKAVIAAKEYNGPVYIRSTGVINTPIVYNEDYEFCIGKAVQIKDGEEVICIANGTIVGNVLKAAELLEVDGINVKVINMHTIKPLDEDTLQDLLHDARVIFTIEEHSIIGGLGGAIAEYISQYTRPVKLVRLGLEDQFVKSGDYYYMIEKNNLHPEGIRQSILNELLEK